MYHLYRSAKAAAATALAVTCFQSALQVADAAVLGHELAIRGNTVRELGGLKVWSLYDAVKNYLANANAYDPSTPDKCVLQVSTTAGGNCVTYVQCEQSDSPGQNMGPWNVCYLNGRQFFHHDLLGDFSIQFTQAGGDTDGLHHPVFQFAALDNWEPLNVEDIRADQAKTGKDTGKLCGWQPDIEGKQTWFCGIPKLERASVSAFGINLMNPDSNKPGFTPGWCTAHVTQYQRNEYGNGDRYAFAVQIFDGAGDQIGSVQKQAVDETGHLNVYSKLPYTFVVSSGDNDDAPVSFSYAGQSWTCDGSNGGAHLCNLGDGKANGYENGDRSGDMGFTC
ncbi:hypothetical protein F4677DRAFT_405916 [Hypoxylon crocopeplum]|nr:hypothetical protein F4677DRAFT_405916 [Hypoxylon crocopeplum]